MAMILCPECGKPISDQAKYCLHCGFSLEKVGAVRVEMSGALFDGWAVFFPPGCHRTKREGVDEIKTEKDG